MEKIFNVNLTTKKALNKKIIKNNKGTTALSLSMLVFLIVFTVGFIYYGLVMHNTFLVQDITATNYGEKNTLVVWTILITTDIIIAFLWCIQKIVVARVLGKNMSDRINESLVVSNDVLEYGYQNSVGFTPKDRVVVLIPLDKMKCIRIDKTLGKVEFEGIISSKYYEDYLKKKTRAPENNYKNGSFVLYDYFEPGLIDYFEKNYKERVGAK